MILNKRKHILINSIRVVIRETGVESIVTHLQRLACKIVAPDNIDINKYLSNSNPNSMFLTATTEEEITKIVSQFDNKNSTDSSNISMDVVKRVF